jgi:hypothetical protein
LNSSFLSYFRDCVAKDPQQYLTDAVQDYIDYANQLEDRYLRSYGEVMTFGSGDCGQLAHGLDGDDDLMVKYPRIVYSLRSPSLPPLHLSLFLSSFPPPSPPPHGPSAVFTREKKVVSIACGGLHNAVCTEEGLVYTWGCGDDGSLGRFPSFLSLASDQSTDLAMKTSQFWCRASPQRPSFVWHAAMVKLLLSQLQEMFGAGELIKTRRGRSGSTPPQAPTRSKNNKAIQSKLWSALCLSLSLSLTLCLSDSLSLSLSL